MDAWLKRTMAGWRACFITADRELPSGIGFKPSNARRYATARWIAGCSSLSFMRRRGGRIGYQWHLLDKCRIEGLRPTLDQSEPLKALKALRTAGSESGSISKPPETGVEPIRWAAVVVARK